jgi:PAS domain S-box-containing protein
MSNLIPVLSFLAFLWGQHVSPVPANGPGEEGGSPSPAPPPSVAEALRRDPVGTLDQAVEPEPPRDRRILYLQLATGLSAAALFIAVRQRRRFRTDLAIREREARFRALVETAPDGIAIYDVEDDRFTDVNSNILEITGFGREEFLQTRLGDTSPELSPDGRPSRDFLREKIEEALEGKTPVFEWVSRKKNQEEIPVEIRLSRFPSEKRKLVRFSALDIRARKEADARREELEAQLRQSQKLEAVGQLTGGVAHDFNNLLTVILGNLDLLKTTRGEDPEIREMVEGAMGAAERSALLTQRLLSFSRRQELDNKPVALPELVRGLLNLLRRSLGETIRATAEFPEDLWLVSADPGQLEHAVINLALNARDSMPRGGDLYLEGSNVVLEEETAQEWDAEEGPYVCLSVTDTGAGMDPGVQNRAFDPFFTTKEVGSGSGLGLSMVYGFVKQSGGFVKIHSAVGRGTAVQLFLPRALSGEAVIETEVEEVFPRGTGETILVVEDEPLLLALTKRLCEERGYTVVVASNAASALEVLRGGTPIDLLFTDVVLPGGLDGVELAEAARARRPDLPILLTSGYAGASVLKMARDLGDFDLLPKPFDSKSLARKLNRALKSTRGHPDFLEVDP